MIRNKILLNCLFCFILLKPFYLWSSGLPQISDLIFLLFIIISPWKFKKNFFYKKKFFLFFIFYTTIINLFYYIQYPEGLDFILPTLYLVFLTLGYFKFYIFLQNEKKVPETLYKSITITTIVQFFILIIKSRIEGRTILFFNNPNQLGYYFLLTLSIFIILNIWKKYYLKYKSFNIIIPILSLVLIVFSQSRASIVGAIFLIGLYYFNIKMLKIKNLIQIVLICVLLVLLQRNNSFNLVKIVEKRFEYSSKQKNNKIIYRGYDRVLNHPEYLIIGSGEGKYERLYYKGIVHTGEFHSTYGNILMSYGIIGFIISMLMIPFILSFKILKYSFPFFNVLFYSLTHNGIRSQLFWIMIAILNYIYHSRIKNQIRKEFVI